MIAALLLADGRFPAGGHAHSGGMEPAVASGGIHDVASLEQFLLGRLHTNGLSAAALCCAAFTSRHSWEELDLETDARTPSPALRESSRRQGRQLVRAAVALWPDERLNGLRAQYPHGPHHPIVMGVTASVAGLSVLDAARCSVYSTVTGPAGAAVKLLALDPLSVHALLAQFSPEMEQVARSAADCAAMPLAQLPCPGSPLLDRYAESHAGSDVRLFAS